MLMPKALNSTVKLLADNPFRFTQVATLLVMPFTGLPSLFYLDV